MTLVLDGCSSASTDAHESAQPGDSGSASLVSAGIETLLTEPRPATIDLDRLSEANGVTLAFEPLEDESIQSFQGIGDVNGDGFSDYSFNTTSRTWVNFGSGARLPAGLSIEELDGSDGFILDEGLRLTPLGDINADGFADVGWMIYDEADGTGVSGVRIVFGRADGEFATALQAVPNGVDGFVLIDEARRDDIRSVTRAGDLNADGYDDVLVGAYAYNGEDFDAPNAWVIYGRANGFAPLVDVASLAPDAGLTLVTRLGEEQLAAVYDSLDTGYNANIAGNFDFNGDGIDDIAIGASSFDWIADVGASHTYIVFGDGTRTAGTIDLGSLDGVDGVDVAGPDLAYQPGPDGVSAVGDINADGIADLAIVDQINAGGVARVLFGGFSNAESRIDRTELSSVASIEFPGMHSDRQNIRLSGAGDVDGDGIDDLGVQTDTLAGIVYGTVERFPQAIDLSLPPPSGVTLLAGSDFAPLVSLGDIDGDGVGDLGIGWSVREYNAGTYPVGDINQDGVGDLAISEYRADYRHLIRVLYGFGSTGLAVVPLAGFQAEPLQVVDSYFLNRLLAAIDAAARSPIVYLNDRLAAGEILGPVASRCIGAAATQAMPGMETSPVEAIDCGAEPLTFSFEWGSGKYTGVAGGGFTRAAFSGNVVQSLHYASEPAPVVGPGGNPYQAHLVFDRDTQLVLGRFDYLDDPAAPRCSIEMSTLQTTDDATTCAVLIAEARDVLIRIFGQRSDVRDFRYLP